MSQTIYHSTLKKDGPTQMKIVGDSHRCPWTDKYTGEDVYSVKVNVNGEDLFFSADKKVINYLASFKGQTITVSAEPNKRIKVEGGEESSPSPSAEGKVTEGDLADKVPADKSKRSSYSKAASAAKEDYWQRKEERDIAFQQRQIAAQPRIERQHSQEMAIQAFGKIPMSLLPKEAISSLDNLRDFVIKLTDHFQKDLDRKPSGGKKVAE
jgi:hypothetical protein